MNRGKNGRVLIGIPTKDRPEYLSALLSSILFQSYTEFDVLIVDTSDGEPAKESVMVQRFVTALRGTGHGVDFIQGVRSGHSMVVPVNRILVEAEDRGYDWVFKVDDDHVMPPATLSSLIQGAQIAEDGHPVVISGVTPFMHRVWEGASSPYDAPKFAATAMAPLTDIWLETEKDSASRGYRHKIEVRHFDQYVSSTVIRTKLGSAANFLMRPDTLILWSDIGGRCLLADAVWFIQLQKLLGYRLYFDVGIAVWHVTAPSGGTRTGEEDFIKGNDSVIAIRRRHLDRVLERLENAQSAKINDGGRSHDQ